MKPIILGIETATDACSVALSTPTQSFKQYVVEPQAHSKLLIGMVDAVCKQAEISLNDVQAFAYGKGPGSFTGLRIAASVIQGLAFGVNKPVIAISSLQALAQQAYNFAADNNVVAILDARMQEVYWGAYSKNSQGLAVNELADCLEKPGFLSLNGSVKYVAVGTGCTAYKDILSAQYPNLNINQTIQYPRAEEIVQLAIAEYLSGNIDKLLTPNQALPVYIRNDVAKKGKKNPD